jgi:hypothetical protein
MRILCKVLVGNPEGDSACRGKDLRGNILKRTLEKLNERVHSLQPPRDPEQMPLFVTTVMSLLVL